MDTIKALLVILMSSVLVNNYVLNKFLGICPFLGVGDRVLISKYAGTEVKVDGVEYSILRQSDILAVVE